MTKCYSVDRKVVQFGEIVTSRSQWGSVHGAGRSFDK